MLARRRAAERAVAARIMAWHHGRVPVYVRDPEDVLDEDGEDLMKDHPRR
ncbi:hypothetical protein [Roseomonas genomospecies 6]|nr:hypothetical protein [Roseomonas genomospecies 6]